MMQRSFSRLAVKFDTNSVCWSCLRKLNRERARGSAALPKDLRATYSTISARGHESLYSKTYFLANDRCSKAETGNGSTRLEASRVRLHQQEPTQEHDIYGLDERPPSQSLPLSRDETLPHRRRKRRQLERDSGNVDAASGIPLDASSQLSIHSTTHPMSSMRSHFFNYLALSKPRLTFLMVLTTTTAYSLFPVAITPLHAAMSLSPITLLNLTTGTALSSACANALNMLLEPEHDAKMSRTRTRPLVRGLLTKHQALGFAIACGTSGVTLLHYGVNPTVAFLSALNIFLYAGVYTPMKRISIANTWVGAVVGGIPPLMGWAAGAGQASMTSDAGWRELLFDPATSTGGWLLAGLLFAWQFPHFNAIAYTIRHEYANAGYKMLASVNVRKNGLIALRYSLAMVPICVGLSYVGVTGWAFVATSGVVNGWMIRQAWRFWRKDGGKGTAKGLFWASVWHLPLILVLAMVHKKGLWERFVKGGFDDEELAEYARQDVESVEGYGENEIVLKDRIA